MTVFVDMDGVLADFETFANSYLGSEWKVEVEMPNWGRLSQCQNLYSMLSPMPDAYDLWRYLHGRFDYQDIQILTAIPSRAYFPSAVDDKREWVAKHFGKNVKVNFGPYAKDKQYHCKEGDILIDDMERNINQWIARGGIGIFHRDAKSTIDELYKRIKP